MHSEARYKNLQTDQFVAKHIKAESITLKDNVIKSDIMTAGVTVKKLYESQRNTNAFDDSCKSKLESLDNAIQRSNGSVTLPYTTFKLPLLNEVHVENIPNQHALMCFDNDGNVIYVCKFNDVVKHYTLPVYEPYVKLDLSYNEESQQSSVSLNVV